MMEKKNIPTLKNFVAGPGFAANSDNKNPTFSRLLIDSYVENIKKNTELLKKENPERIDKIERLNEILVKIIKETIDNDSQ